MLFVHRSSVDLAVNAKTLNREKQLGNRGNDWETGGNDWETGGKPLGNREKPLGNRGNRGNNWETRRNRGKRLDNQRTKITGVLKKLMILVFAYSF